MPGLVVFERGCTRLGRDKSSLLFVYLRVLQDMQIAFQDLIYLDVLENVASMDKLWVGVMSRALNRFPLRIGSESLSCVRRSRLFWLSFDIVYWIELPRVENIVGALEGRPFKGRVIATVNATQLGTSTVQNLPLTRNPFLVGGESWDEVETVDTTTSETDEIAASSLALSLMTRASI